MKESKKQQKKLTLQMGIFSFIIFVAFGVIIVTEKTAPYFSYRIDEKFNKYLQTNYTSIINEFDIGKTNYKKTKYQLKITSNENKNLYFYLKYSNKNIEDTYKKDYLEGKTLLNKISKDMEDTLQKKYNKEFKIKFLTTLDKITGKRKEQILKEENILSIPIYSLQATTASQWNTTAITQEIQSFHNTLKIENITPNSYILTIDDINKENKSIKISNLTKKTIENTEILTIIINDIINGKNSDIIKENNISYKQI